MIIQVKQSGYIPQPIVPIYNLVDIDGNIYNTTIIGTQEWITRNLDVTRYADGSVIPITAQWTTDTVGAKCYYNNDETTYRSTYGTLYNWYAVNNVLGLAYLHKNGVNQNFRIPSQADFITLGSYLGGLSSAGGKLKETGFSHWNSPNTGATNETGFDGVGSGYRTNIGSFGNIKGQGFFYTSTLFNGSNTWHYYLRDFNAALTQNAQTFRWGLSVRLMRDI